MREALVLTKAAVRSAHGLGLTYQDLAAVLGTDDATIGRFAEEREYLRPDSDGWKAALMLVELRIALFRLVGGNEAQMRSWMKGYNRALDAAPLDVIRSFKGLDRILDYLRAACSSF